MRRGLLLLACVVAILAPIAPAQSGTAGLTAADLWLDTDLSCGSGTTRDVDDCIALTSIALQAPSRLAGISLTYGNASIETVVKTTDRLRPVWVQQTGKIVPWIKGAARRGDCNGNLASQRLVANSQRRNLTVLALGPLTNLACALTLDPTLAKRLTRVVIVGGAVPGHVFHPAEGAPQALFGHGPIARDFNIERDAGAMSRVLSSGVAITLVPYQAARDFRISSHDLDRLSRLGPLAARVSADARPWLQLWQNLMGLDGFYPFDLLAVAAVLRPTALTCNPIHARVTADRAISGHNFGPSRLIVGPLPWTPERSQEQHGERLVIWCHHLAPDGAGQLQALIGPSP